MKFSTGLIAAVFGVISAAAGETVSVGAGYANDVFYHVEARAKAGEAPNANWDIAFETKGFTGSILINGGAGVTLWATELTGADGFKQTIDTNALFASASWFNSSLTWHQGAFNMDKDASAGDFGWGRYNPQTHEVKGTTVFVAKLPDGTTRKIFMDGLAGDNFTFRYANIDGTDEQAKTFRRNEYAAKSFVYFSVRTGQFLDREPAAADWHLVFGKYQTIVTEPVTSPYVVTGVRSNVGVKIAKYKGANPAGATDAGLQYLENITAIGHDWKMFNNGWSIADDVAYFVQIPSVGTYKIIFTGFGGQATGNINFTVEDAVTSVEEDNTSFAVFPNPASGAATVVFAAAGTAELTLTDATGRVVRTESFSGANGLTPLDLTGLPQGVYMLSLTSGTSRLARQIVVR